MRLEALRKRKVLTLVRSLRGGRLYDGTPGSRMRGEGAYATHVERLFRTTARRLGYAEDRAVVSTAALQRPGGQVSLFETT